MCGGGLEQCGGGYGVSGLYLPPHWHRRGASFALNAGLVLLLGLWLHGQTRLDVAALSVVVLGVNVILLSLVGRALAETDLGLFALFLFGAAALAVLAASGQWLMRLQVKSKLNTPQSAAAPAPDAKATVFARAQAAGLLSADAALMAGGC